LDHIIVVTMENRSFDHFLGWLPGADGKQAGLTFLDRAGIAQSTHHLTDFQGCGFADPSHSFAGGRVDYNNGACDGWLRAENNDLYTIGYYEETDLPFFGKAARLWTVCDRYFTAFMGPTGPNRLILHAGQTDRLSNSTTPSTLPAIWDRLADAGVSGKNYGTRVVGASAFGSRYTSIIRPMTEFFSDAAAGTLPNVAYVDPNYTAAFSNDFHPPADIRIGDAFLQSIYQAVIAGPVWESSLLVITFDEWGGFFDHAPPPVAPIPPAEQAAGNVDGLRGFRIPTILISPFARRSAVDSGIYDHASVLKLIEWRWSLEPLTSRDANANNLAEALDFSMKDLDAPMIPGPSGTFGVTC
jgi:phospholipase C